MSTDVIMSLKNSTEKRSSSRGKLVVSLCPSCRESIIYGTELKKLKYEVLSNRDAVTISTHVTKSIVFWARMHSDLLCKVWDAFQTIVFWGCSTKTIVLKKEDAFPGCSRPIFRFSFMYRLDLRNISTFQNRGLFHSCSYKLPQSILNQNSGIIILGSEYESCAININDWFDISVLKFLKVKSVWNNLKQTFAVSR